MSRDSHRYEPLDGEPVTQEPPYGGALGRTRLETVHWALPGGEIAAVRVHTVVNATSDPGLAERLLSGDLNWVQPAGSPELQQVTIPILYHDETQRIFALILPEGFRGRELQERARLLQRLAEEGSQPIPRYVLHVDVVYGESGLAERLERGSARPVAAHDDELAEREDQIVAREAKLAEWAEQLAEEQDRLQVDLKQRALLDDDFEESTQAGLRRREQELSRKEAELREVEELLVERQADLDQLEQRLLQQPIPMSDGDSPTAVADRKRLALAVRESAEEVDESAELRLTEDESSPQQDLGRDDGEEVDEAAVVAEEAVAAPAGTPEPEPAEEAGDASGGPPPRRVRAPEITPLAEAVLAVAEDSERKEVETDITERPPLEVLQPDATAAAGSEEEDEDEEEVAAVDLMEEEPEEALPEELVPWRDQTDYAPLWYQRDSLLHLAVALPPEDAELFVGIDPVALLQMHAFETYPLITLGMVADGTAPEGEEPFSVFWPFDIAQAAERAVLEQLATDFRVVLEVYDESLEPVTQQELHFPLEENVRLVIERADATLSAITQDDRSPEVALEVFQAEGYDRILPGELAFGPMAYQDLGSAAAVAEALTQVATWFTAEREDELLLRRSFPAASWRALRLRVLRAAVEFGVFMDKPLRRVALDAGLATSKRDLLRACLAGCERVSLGELQSGLSAQAEHENWTALLEEAERLGVPVEPRAEELAVQAAAKAEAADEEDAGASLRQGDAGEGEAEAASTIDPEDLVDGDGPVIRVHTDEVELIEEADLLEEEALEEALEEVEGEAEAEAEEVVDASALILEGEEEAEPGDDEPRDLLHETSELLMGAGEQEDLSDLSPPELVVMLGDPHGKVNAAIELCRRKEARAVPEIFGVLDSMPRQELIRLFPHLVGLGPDSAPYFTESLRSPVSLIRLGSSLAVAALRADLATEGLIDLLLDEPTDQWPAVAQALGDLGSNCLMSLASRIRHTSAEQKERLAEALARVSGEAAGRQALVDLSESRDEEAAGVARRALEQWAENSLESDDPDETPSRDDAVAFFTYRLLAVVNASGSDHEEILEADDLIEEADIAPEEP